MKSALLAIVCMFAASNAQAAFIGIEKNQINIGVEERDYGHSVIADAMQRAGIAATAEQYDGRSVTVRRMNNVVVIGLEAIIELIEPADFLNSSAGHVMKRAYNAIAVTGETAVQLEQVVDKIKLNHDDDDEAELSISCAQRDEGRVCLVWAWL